MAQQDQYFHGKHVKGRDVEDQDFIQALHAPQSYRGLSVLPPPPPSDLPIASAGEAAAAVRVTRAIAATLLGESELAGSAEHPEVSERWDRMSGDLHTYRTRVRLHLVDPPAACDSLLEVRDALRDNGWGPEPVDSPTPWLVAISPTGLEVDVAAEQDCLVLTVSSPRLRLSQRPA